MLSPHVDQSGDRHEVSRHLRCACGRVPGHWQDHPTSGWQTKHGRNCRRVSVSLLRLSLWCHLPFAKTHNCGGGAGTGSGAHCTATSIGALLDEKEGLLRAPRQQRSAVMPAATHTIGAMSRDAAERRVMRTASSKMSTSSTGASASAGTSSLESKTEELAIKRINEMMNALLD